MPGRSKGSPTDPASDSRSHPCPTALQTPALRRTPSPEQDYERESDAGSVGDPLLRPGIVYSDDSHRLCRLAGLESADAMVDFPRHDGRRSECDFRVSENAQAGPPPGG